MTALHASLSHPTEVRPGTHLGRYQVLLGIAEGGMARVWAAQQHGQHGFSKTVAIKTILPALASDSSFESMFLDEARLAACIHHPNVCEIFDLGEEAGVLYLAMEWVNGESLGRLIKPPRSDGQKPTPVRLDARVAARIIADAAKGLHAAHELTDEFGQSRNVVHRDVSPQNILVSTTGTVKVTDFGVAKALGGSQEATMAGQIKGKAAYMSPEQAGGGKIDRRSDIFALGICLYEATTGVRPFTGEGQIAVLQALISGQFQAPSAVVPNYPRELEVIVMRAMAMNPDQRFATADQFRMALEEFLARSGPLVTESAVADLVRERVGPQVEERVALIRERMKSAVASPEMSHTPFTTPQEASSSKISNPSASAIRSVAYASQPSSPSSVGGTPPPTYMYPAPAPAGPSSAKLALAGVLVGVALFAVGGTALVLMRGPSEPAAATTAAAAAATAPTPPPPAATAAPAPTKLVKLNLVQPTKGVRFELDGKTLPQGTVQVPRPASGQTSVLIARADGHKQDSLRIDDTTPEILDVLLEVESPEPKPEATKPNPEPVAAKKPEPAAPAAGPTPVSAGPTPVAPKPVKKPPKPDIPDNPF